MVRKLFKHEMIAYLRVWIPMQIILMAVACSVRILQFFESDSTAYSIVNGTSVLLYFLTVIASLGLTLIFGIVRFYKNLFSNEGYLSFTLPVATTQHIFSKVLSAGIFMIFTYVSVLISALIVSSGELLSGIMQDLGDFWTEGYALAGSNLIFYVIEALLVLCVVTFTQFLLYYTCIALGQLFRKNRVIGAVVVYFIYYVISQAIGTIFVIFVSLAAESQWIARITQYFTSHVFGSIHLFLCGSIVLELLLATLYYFITHTVIRKKLNLE